MEKTVHNSDLNHQRYWTVKIWIMKSIFHLFSSTEQGLELVSLFYDFQFARPWIVVFVTILILGKLLLVFFFWVVFVTADLSNFMSPWVCGFYLFVKLFDSFCFSVSSEKGYYFFLIFAVGFDESELGQNWVKYLHSQRFCMHSPNLKSNLNFIF